MILWPDGFGHYGTDRSKMDQYANVGTRWAPATTNPRTGTHSLKFINGAGANGSIDTIQGFRRVFPTGQSVIKLGYAFWVDRLPSMETNFAGLAAVVLASFITAIGGTQVHIVLGTDGSIAAYDNYLWATDGGLGTLLGRSDPCVHISSWNHFEVRAAIDSVVGAIEVRIDGVTRLSLADINTNGRGGGVVLGVVITGGTTLNSIANMYVADLIASNGTGTNSDFLGDQQVFTDFPNADTAAADWLPSSGSALYAMVDENPPDELVTYLEAENPDDVVGLNFPALPATVKEVIDVAVFHRTKKTGAGGSKVQGSIESGGFAADGVDNPMVTVFQGWLDNFEVDPNGDVPWTPAAAGSATPTLTRTL